MSYKTILVHSDADKAASARVAVAAELAQRFDAKLIGLFARPPFQMPAFSDGSFSVAPFIEGYEKSVQLDRAAAHDGFDKIVNPKRQPAEWHSADGELDRQLAFNARHADLVILSQADRSEPTPIPPTLPEAVAMASGRPVLVLPRIGAGRPLGKTVMLCWNASRESARAASDALPLLRAADKVILMVVDAKPGRHGHGQEPGADAAAWLARHGVKVTVQRDVAADSDAGNVILSRAADWGVDLIVMGVYGHSRTREWVLGGASRSVLASMTVPVLMSH
jgi:nucleotide-binding universal stress UspA family protein